ncbi:hypothetical protein B0A48_09019 [Cryoendolithus antarcticus]|uniref:GED domain-containing protein n=1 Tax=Cryoendolithus antarcticus TaxID=1507870 RepID=A0A1V8T265_9PEZI|nr:hypothetical protein B0A48_09019 [Cryoendolithus antarcticus]
MAVIAEEDTNGNGHQGARMAVNKPTNVHPESFATGSADPVLAAWAQPSAASARGVRRPVFWKELGAGCNHTSAFSTQRKLCTRYATEINLRRALTDTIATRIIPDQSRPAEERTKLSAFNETITDFSRLPGLMDKATTAMGLNAGTASSHGTLAFTCDVLSIEISGPGHPQLTLVDLPGLIHTPTKEQTREDVKLIHEMVSEYLEEKSTIMLAVVSAKNDYANQMILHMCRNIDPHGNRTLGIVTKPDTLKAGSVNEAAWIELARDTNIYFNLGWHILKNRYVPSPAPSSAAVNLCACYFAEMQAQVGRGGLFSPPDSMCNSHIRLHLEMRNTIAMSFEARNAHEKTFLSAGAYKSLPSHTMGILSLRVRLSQLLYTHLKKELPTLQKELNARLEQTTDTLEELGEKRSTAAEQKRFLFEVSMQYQATVEDAVMGDYAHPFFETSDITQGFGDPVTARRLRAAVHHLNQQFAIQMRQYGHTFRIATEKDFDGTNAADEVPRVHNLLLRSRGMELPGNSNPLFMSQLFWQQSKNWKTLAAAHIERVNHRCNNLVKAAIEHTTLEGQADKLFETKLEPKLTERYEGAVQELDKLIADKQRTLCTYNPAYTTTLWTSRKKRVTSRTQAVPVNTTVVQKAEGQQDMEKTNAEDALDSLIAYYKGKVEYFIEAVTDQVVERHLLTNLAGETFSPLQIDAMSEHEVYQIAGEDEDITSQREHFEGQKQILEKGQAAFRKALGGLSLKQAT